eukprot:5784461-Amphidinium_carterae.1
MLMLMLMLMMMMLMMMMMRRRRRENTDAQWDQQFCHNCSMDSTINCERWCGLRMLHQNNSRKALTTSSMDSQVVLTWKNMCMDTKSAGKTSMQYYGTTQTSAGFVTTPESVIT